MENFKIRKPSVQEEANKRLCLELLSQDRQRLLVKWPFIGNIIMRMELIPVRDDRLHTACTDNENIFVDINFYASLSTEERLFVLAHEIWHCVLLHFARRQDRDAELFNIATDLEIHFTLAAEKMKEPYVLPHLPSWNTLSAEEIYEQLPDFLKKQEKLDSPKKNGKTGKGTKHDKHNDAIQPFGDKTKCFDKHIYKDDTLPDPDDMGAHEATDDNAEGSEFVIDADYKPLVKADAVERSRARTIAAAQQVERTQGNLPANIRALLEQLEKPAMPWQELLKQAVTSCYGGKRRWLPPARRHVWHELYLPSMRDDALKAVVALDTSGSTQNDLPVFFGELLSLMKTFGKFDLTVIQCDMTIQHVEHYTETKLPPQNKKWEVHGLGGTDFRPVFDYVAKEMRDQPDMLIFFTDGYGDAPESRPSYPVLWMLTNDGEKPAQWGRAIKFKNKEGNQ